ncbi:MAG: NUDIX hydrolase [Lachnospiraceae bacterium]
MKKLKRLKRELKFEGAIVSTYVDTIEMPDQTTALWDYIEHRKGAAAVVAVTDQDEIVLVRQYRNALNRETLEIPAGARDDINEDTAVCAKRELEEETGFKCAKIERILSLKSTVAFCNELIDVYLATELSQGTQNLDEHEFIEIEFHKLDDLLNEIYAGNIQDAKTVAGILAYSNMLRGSKYTEE